MTIREKLKFGLDEPQAIVARERRVKGVLIDAVKDVKILKERIKILEKSNEDIIRHFEYYEIVVEKRKEVYGDTDKVKIHPDKLAEVRAMGKSAQNAKLEVEKLKGDK